MADEALKIIGEIQHVRLQPGDVIIANCNDILSVEQQQRLRQFVIDVFPDHKVIVLDKRVSLNVARREPASEVSA